MEHNIEVIQSRLGGIHIYASHGDFQKPSVANVDEIKPGEWHISRVMVVEKFRGQGLGSKLLNIIIEKCRENGAKSIKVTPGGYGADSKRQQNFYKRVGFKLSKNRDFFILNLKP